MFRRSNFRDILIMVWSVDAVRSGEPERAKTRMQFPRNAIGAKPGEGHFVAPWTLETLVNEALVHRSADRGSKRLLNTRHWSSFASLFNLINEIENAESLDDIPEMAILGALPRIGWRQFGWQIGYKTANRFFRSWWLYNFPEANDFFLKTYGVSVERFCYVGFAVASQLIKYPAVRPNTTLSKVGITDEERDAFFRMVSLSSANARKHAAKERKWGKGQIAYKPSVLRRKPMITITNENVLEAYCPLPALLYLRFTDGLFYDLIENSDLKRIIGERFEDYAFEINRHYLSDRYRIFKEDKYGARSKQRATPDLRIINGEHKLKAIIECKSRRIPFKVLSSPNPYFENKDVFAELVKGVTQIWRYVADVRLGRAECDWRISSDVIGVILMLEPWLQMYSETIRSIKQRAVMECERYPEVEEVDQIEITFVAVDDWEYSLGRIRAEGFLRALHVHATPRKHGYLLGTIVDELAVEEDSDVVPYDYHAGISRLVSWWDEIGENRIPEPPCEH